MGAECGDAIDALTYLVADPDSKYFLRHSCSVAFLARSEIAKKAKS
jgi:hypothetical protein